jgi:DNA-directed RNA polymerase subunit F
MTRQPHDQFAKEYLEELLTPLGTIKKSQKVKSEVQEIDVWFEPLPSSASAELPLGLLGKMATTSCLFEPFRNPPSEVEIRSCLSKLYAVHGDLLRKAKRSNITASEAELPILWILAPTLSERILQGLGATKAQDWGQGVYFLSPLLRTGIIVIHQLPVNEDTLWLRVLGKGGTQKRAVEELVQLPEDNTFKENLLEILANWRKNLELRDNLSTEEQEDIMNLSPAYLKQREDWKQEGLTEGKREMVENLLRVRFGELDEEMKGVIAQLLPLPSEELTRLLLNLSREELLQRFRKN